MLQMSLSRSEIKIKQIILIVVVISLKANRVFSFINTFGPAHWVVSARKKWNEVELANKKKGALFW